MYNEWGQKLKCLAVNDPAVKSLLDLQKGSKASKLESLRQKKQLVTGEGSNAAHNKYYDSSDNDSEATLYSLSSDTTKESENETDDADKFDMDLSNDNPNKDDDVASSKSTRGSTSKNQLQGSKTFASERQQQQQEWDAWIEDTIIDEDEVILKNETPELIEEFQNVDKRVPTIFDHERRIKLGIESYQIKINLTTPTLIFPGIKARDPYSIVDRPTIGLIYLNSKNEKRIMNLVEIEKFYDAMLERVLKKVKLKIFETEFLKKAPLLDDLDLNLMKAYEREINKRLRHHEQMRR
nr:hypothetical protein [Tanacetum cinerariifolium]